METLLPPRPKTEIPSGEHVDEVSMVEYESTRGSRGAAHGGHSHGGAASMFGHGGPGGGDEDDDDDEAGPGGAQRVQCASS